MRSRRLPRLVASSDDEQDDALILTVPPPPPPPTKKETYKDTNTEDDEDEKPLVPRRKVASVKRVALPARRRVKQEPLTPVPPKRKATVKAETLSPASKLKRKPPIYTEEHFEPINTWWDKPLRSKTDPHWTYLEHNGIMFYPPYKPHHIPMVYNGHPVELPSASEEIANFWCSVQSSEYPSKSRFIDNFWTAFLSSFKPDHPFILGKYESNAAAEASNASEAAAKEEEDDDDDQPLSRKRRKVEKTKYEPSFEKANFDDIQNHLDAVKAAEKEARKARSKEEREQEKRLKLKQEGPFLYALHDGVREKVATYKAEVPGLFRGRGEHPKMGKLKRRIFPDEVCLNLAEEAPIPKLPEWLRGHSWQDVYHDNTVTWLAYYRDTVNNSFKYVFLGASSAVKGMKDLMKYELARKLKQSIDKIRADYRSKMQSDDLYEKQLGTATYVIDALALRVGNEKDREEEADTVGCCSLRKEHVTGMDEKQLTVTLDFLGKDSIRYLNTVTLDALAFKNLKSFCKGKTQQQNIFDLISTGSLNRYLKDLMPGLSAKVFRTYNASVTLQRELQKAYPQPGSPEPIDMSHVDRAKRFYEDANRTVAILCNHQRSIPKQHDASMEKLQKQLRWLKEDIHELQSFIDWCKDGKAPGDFVYTETITRELDVPVRNPCVKPNMKLDAADRKLLQIEQRATTLELRIKMKDENKTVANNTSKQHYMDPRITVTFCKRFDLPIEKFFNASLLKKFPWAMYAHLDFVW